MCLIKSVTGEKADASQRVLPSGTPERRPGDQTSACGIHGGRPAAIPGCSTWDEEPDPRRVLPYVALSSEGRHPRARTGAPAAAAPRAPCPVRPTRGADPRAYLANQRSVVRQVVGGGTADSG